MNSQWRTMSHQNVGPNHVNIEVAQNSSELFRAECSRLISETNTECTRMQKDVLQQLDERVKDIQFLKKELELKVEEIIIEIDDLIVLKSRVMKALEATNEPLRVTLLCLDERKKRVPSERLLDDVDRELFKETEVIEGVAPLLKRVIEQITEQIRLNRSVKYLLEQDLKEKSEAQCIDNSCALMTVNQRSINDLQMSKNTTTAQDSMTVTPKQWENISYINIAKAEVQKANSQSLQALVESVLEQTATDMEMQLQATTAAFHMNVNVIKAAKNQMEERLAKILLESANLERSKVDLQVAITETEQALTLTEARLALRKQRPSKEQCNDPVQFKLRADISRIIADINKLREKVAKSEGKKKALDQCQRELQKNIDSKASSIYIDEVTCAQHREPVIIPRF